MACSKRSKLLEIARGIARSLYGLPEIGMGCSKRSLLAMVKFVQNSSELLENNVGGSRKSGSLETKGLLETLEIARNFV